mgnify:CR=1 FL=1
MKLFNKICNAIIKLYTYAGVFLLVVIAIACMVQVFSRYLMSSAIVGTEEISRYCFVWLGFLGSAVCVQRWSNAHISILNDLLKGRLKSVHTVILNIAVIICATVLLAQGLKCVSITTRQLSSMLRIPMCYVYAAIPAGAFGMIVGALQRLLNVLTGKDMEVSA